MYRFPKNFVAGPVDWLLTFTCYSFLCYKDRNSKAQLPRLQGVSYAIALIRNHSKYEVAFVWVILEY